MPSSVCPRQKFHCCQIASGSPHESSEIVPQQPGCHVQQDWMLNCASVSSRISPDLPPCFSSCSPEPPLLSVTPQPHVLLKETLNEFDQSSGRAVRGLLSQKENDFHHEKQVSVDSNQSRGIFQFCLSSGRRCLPECKIECDHRELFSLLVQVTSEMCNVVVPLLKVELDQGGSLVSPVL